ncbi:MAG: hypothetical protein ACE15E_21670 [Acidobacteriota bacterium]
MRALGCLLVILLAGAIGLFLYRSALTETTVGGGPPQQQIDTVGVRMDLQSIARAEKIYVITHGRYGSFQDLVSDGAIPFSSENRRGYTYGIESEGDRHFRVTARPADPARTEWPTFAIDETGQLVQEP